MFNRVFLVVMDSVGIGELPDALEYGDVGSNTIGNIAKQVNGLNIPNLQKMGIGNITTIQGVNPTDKPIAYYTKSNELSVGKDTMTGHWEIMGIHTTEPFKVFTETGFPKELMDEITAATGYELIGNKAASGTEILDELGEQHVNERKLIVYTSADSVLQIAAHEDIVSAQELWDICKKVRAITMKEDWLVGRIIARPFIGDAKNGFKRTPNRHDYALSPSDTTTLDYMKEANLDVISIGKISDIYNGSGITEGNHTVSNDDGMDQLIHKVTSDFKGLCFLNLVDFDAVYGHRRDVAGYAKAIEAFDVRLGEVLQLLKNDDLLIITADHGNDPTMPGTDHTREYIPVLIYSKQFTNPKELPVFDTFANIGATISEIFNVKQGKIGTSILDSLK